MPKTKQEIIKILKRGGIGVMPTDTIYGLVALASNKSAVERVYRVRRRSPDKPFIILIASIDDLKLFGVKITKEEKAFLEKNWPGAVSVVLSCAYVKFKYLHRGTNTLAFRLPAKKYVRDLVEAAGPLIAPSANLEGEPPATRLVEARNYFDQQIYPIKSAKGGQPAVFNGVDFYYGHGERKSPPSTLVKLDDGKVEILRQGMARVKV